MKTSIALIGFMGTGKTAVGHVLARKLNMEFFEIDALIEVKAGRTIPQIFEDGGEIGFRELEIEVAKEIAQEEHAVIACGGGLVLNRINIDRLKQGAVIVCLTASPAVALKRVSREVGQRPLLEVEDPLGTIRHMMKSRRPFYAQAADITVNTSKMSTDSVAEAIIMSLRNDESFDRPK